MQALTPNTAQLSYYDKLALDTKKNDFGLIIYIPFSSAGLAIEKTINLWMTNIPADWKETFNIMNNDLSTLVSLLICRNWKRSIDVQILNNSHDIEFSETDLNVLYTMIRLPKNATITMKQGALTVNVITERNTDINIFNIEQGMTVEDMVKIVTQSRISAIFCADSAFENVLV